VQQKERTLFIKIKHTERLSTRERLMRRVAAAENAIDANKLLQLTSEPASSYECVLLAITYTLISQRAEMVRSL